MPGVYNEISLQNAKLNGAPLDIAVFQGVESGATWNITGADLTNGFTFEGDIVLAGMQPGSDNRITSYNVCYTKLLRSQLQRKKLVHALRITLFDLLITKFFS